MCRYVHVLGSQLQARGTVNGRAKEGRERAVYKDEGSDSQLGAILSPSEH